MRLIAVFTCSAFLFQASQAAPPKQPSPEAIEAALKVMQDHFLHKDTIDWSALKETFAQAAGAQVPAETYPAIRFALAKLGDHHSYLQLTPELTREETARQPHLANPAAMPAPPTCKPSVPFPSPFRTRRVPEGAMITGQGPPLADIVIPSFASPNRRDVDDFATSIQRVIADLAMQKPCGWIVDLRGNGGGNIWAMKAGVGPILGDGTTGLVINEDGSKDEWFYEKGRTGVRHDSQNPDYAKVTGTPVVINGTPPVAVLIDRETGSSAEGIAIAFHGRADTRVFGELTFGAATGTFPYPLSDGAQIFLVTGVMFDRNGNEYPNGVAPDEEILSEATISTNDPVIRAASVWLSGQSACRGR